MDALLKPIKAVNKKALQKKKRSLGLLYCIVVVHLNVELCDCVV